MPLSQFPFAVTHGLATYMLYDASDFDMRLSEQLNHPFILKYSGMILYQIQREYIEIPTQTHKARLQSL